MKAIVYNICLFVGWGLGLIGGCLYSVPLGLVGAGVALVALTILNGYVAGVRS